MKTIKSWNEANLYAKRIYQASKYGVSLCTLEHPDNVIITKEPQKWWVLFAPKTNGTVSVVAVLRGKFSTRGRDWQKLESAPMDVQKYLDTNGMRWADILECKLLKRKGNTCAFQCEIDVKKTEVKDGVFLSTIIEGTDAEFGERIFYPFTEKELFRAAQSLEDACQEWEAENEM